MDHQQNFNLDSDTNDIIKKVYYSCTEIFLGKVGQFQRRFQNILGKKGKETGLGFQSGLRGGGRVRLPEDSLNFPPESKKQHPDFCIRWLIVKQTGAKTVELQTISKHQKWSWTLSYIPT